MVVKGLLWVSVLSLLLAGCGGGDRMERESEIPVGCVAGFKSAACAPGRGKFYYDYGTNRCLPTSGRGCGGRQLFDSLDRCVDYCGAANR